MTQGRSLSDHPAVAALIVAMGGSDVTATQRVAEFDSDDCLVIVSTDDRFTTLRIRVYLPTDEEDLVREWVNAQEDPRSGILQYAETDGLWSPRLVFERASQERDWTGDAMFEDVSRYRLAWMNESTAQPPSSSIAPFAIENDPVALAPASAWLLLGSEASFPSPSLLERDRAAAKVGIFEWDWTTAAQSLPGDLALFYFTAPRMAIHFVARSAAPAFFSRDITVGADKPVARAQWWGRFTRPIPIEPIELGELRRAADGHILLRGRSGKFLHPRTIDVLRFRALDPADQAELDRVVTTPVGMADLPPAEDTGPDVWRRIAPGALPLEAHVSTHLVEPLLHHVLADTGVTFEREYRIERRLADYVLLDRDRASHVIEVKKAIRRTVGDDWYASPDYAQVRWYAEKLGTRSTLIDSTRVLLIDEGGAITGEIDRQHSTDSDLQIIARHLLT